jgi:hypothetical protein
MADAGFVLDTRVVREPDGSLAARVPQALCLPKISSA